ncbi:hypothetical protein ACT3OH_15965 [Vreelandella zhanjiangensis]|uniref:hypothetical protein n=1 Tax=Vreelandella zhanjiangensis TaxID=1121960 RepID=UPI00402AEDB6
MKTEHAEFLCGKIEIDVPEAESAVIDCDILKVYYQRNDGSQRLLATSLIGIDPCRLDDQESLVAHVRQTIAADNH